MTINKSKYKATLKTHKAEIKQLKRNIKAHRLMIKQARTAWKVAKLTGAKVSTKVTNPSSSKSGMSYEATA